MASSWITPEEAYEALAKGTGRGVRIAVLDSGIDVSHPALVKARIEEHFTVSGDESGHAVVETEPGDIFGHGTAVAHIIHEVAPEAELGSFQILQSREGQIAGPAEMLQTAVQAAIDRGYHIVNCSFGTPARSVIFKYFKSWVDAAYLNDVHIVTACNNANYTRPEWPAHFPSVIAVNMGRVAGNELYYRPGQLVEFFARGERVHVPWLGGSWKTVTGSSYAAPRVTGLIARLLSRSAPLSAPLVKAILRQVATPWAPEVAGENVWD